MNAKERILSESEILFKKYGARSITMDDLAVRLSISKKTLYQHFDDKQALVYQVTKRILIQIETQMDSFRHNSENAIDELIQVMEFTSQLFKNINPNMLFDLRNHFSRSWKLYRTHMKTCMQAGVALNIRRGIGEKLYRDDIDPEMIALMLMAQIDAFFNPELMPLKKIELQKMHQQVTNMFLHGLLSEKGFQQLKKHKQKLKQ
jgi:AcrR family transcriptional regulator